MVLRRGFIKTTDNRFFGDSDDGSTEFTGVRRQRIVQAIALGIALSGQLLSRRAGEMYDGSPVIDYALVDWTISNTPKGAYGVMIGRSKIRSVCTTTRGRGFHPTGASFSATGLFRPGAESDPVGRWSAVLRTRTTNTAPFAEPGAGSSPGREIEISFIGTDFGGELDSGDPAFIARGEFETRDGAWRLLAQCRRVNLRSTRPRRTPSAAVKSISVLDRLCAIHSRALESDCRIHGRTGRIQWLRPVGRQSGQHRPGLLPAGQSYLLRAIWNGW